MAAQVETPGLRERPKILVMDDSQTVLEATQEVLEEGGYDVVTLSSSALLPSVWNQEKPDLALIDVSMPVMEGQSVVELMRRSHLHRCPLVLYSDQPEPRLQELARACGASGYIRKTHDGAALLRQVASYVSVGLVAPRAATGERSLVFIVDDDAMARAAMEEAVLLAGGEPVAFARGDACLAELARRRPALVLMDLVMAPMSGDVCCRAIRDNRALADLPVMLVSAGASTVQVMQAWRAGADDFMAKPIRPELLAPKLRAVREAESAEAAAAPDSMRPVLLADHSAFSRGRLGRMLECGGYRVLYAKSADEAVELATTHSGELRAVLVNLAMPGPAPLELVKTLKRQCSGPLLALTDVGAESDLSRAVEKLTNLPLLDKKGPCEHVVTQLSAALRQRELLPVAGRAPFFSVVSFRASPEAAWSTGFAFDLSPGGIFITTLTPAAAGAALELQVTFPGLGAVACAGQVAWANGLAGRSEASYLVGMGVKFSGGDEAFARTLAQFTRSAASEKAKSA
jgi:CheY-like chemotaxis protein